MKILLNFTHFKFIVLVMITISVVMISLKYSLANAKSPDNKDANYFYNLGTHFYQKMDYASAIKNYEKAIQIKPDFEKVYFGLATAFLRKGDHKQAIKNFKMVIDINPNYEEAYNNLGNTYFFLGEYDQAILNIKKAIEINPHLAKQYFSLANAYREKKEYDLAIDNYNKAIEIDKNFIQAYYNLARTYEAKGNYKDALEKYNYLIKIWPHNYLAEIARVSISEIQSSNSNKEKIFNSSLGQFNLDSFQDYTANITFLGKNVGLRITLQDHATNKLENHIHNIENYINWLQNNMINIENEIKQSKMVSSMDSWAEEEELLSPEEFIKRIKLKNISITIENGELSDINLYYDDDNIFGGHFIQVTIKDKKVASVNMAG